MSKKRSLKPCNLQADFWTALPIDRCRARIVARQSNTTTLEHHYDSSPQAAAQFSSFKLIHYHQLPYAQRMDKSSEAGVYPMIINGRMQATSDGTRVTLKIAAETQSRLRLESGLTRGNTSAFAVLLGVLFAVGCLSTYLNPIAENIKGITVCCPLVVIFGAWLVMLGLSVSGLGSRHPDLAATAESLITTLHADLYASSHDPAPNTNLN